MNFRILSAQVITALAVSLSVSIALNAQISSTQANSATRVAAEMTSGRLSPAVSKTGDMVVVRLKDDLKSNGHVVLKKGTVITGIVRNVSRGEPKTRTQSMIELEWLVPSADENSQNLSLALQSVTQLRTISREEQTDPIPVDFASRFARPNRSGASNPALLNMPSVVAVDHQTSSAIENGLDSAEAGPLFKVGHGELITVGGTAESVDLFSHLSNDSVITSASRNFEISSGAQVQLLVGINK